MLWHKPCDKSMAWVMRLVYVFPTYYCCPSLDDDNPGLCYNCMGLCLYELAVDITDTSNFCIVSHYVLRWRFMRSGEYQPLSAVFPLVVFISSVAVWEFAYGLERLSAEISGKLFWSDVQFILLAVMAPAFLAFTLAYTTIGNPFTGWKRWLFFVEPLFVLIALVSDPSLSLFRINPVLQAAGSFDIITFTRGPAWYVHVLYTYLMMLAGTVANDSPLTAFSPPDCEPDTGIGWGFTAALADQFCASAANHPIRV